MKGLLLCVSKDDLDLLFGKVTDTFYRHRMLDTRFFSSFKG